MNSPLDPSASAGVSPLRTSEVLRGILTKNPCVNTFSVQRILESIGSDRVEASLTMFSIPAIVPVPGPRGFVALPTRLIATQLVSGKQISFPSAILAKTVSRRALAVAIHAALPILEAAEKIMRPRWNWVSHPWARRVLGLFVFVLAVAIAYPVFGFNALHATSIFVISLGMAERDGLAVMIGVCAGVLSLAILVTSGVSVRAWRGKALKLLRKLARKIGLAALATALEKHGYPYLAKLVSFDWSELLLKWDPEMPATKTETAPVTGPRKTVLLDDGALQPRAPRFRDGRQPIQRARVPDVDQSGAHVGEQTSL